MRKRPSSPRAMPRTSCTVRSSCPSMRRASPRSRVPSGVSSTRRRLRVNRTTPRRCSRARIARDSGGCEICSAAAARPKCSRSATARKYRNCHNSGRSIPAEYYSRTATALACPGASSENRASRRTPHGCHARKPPLPTHYPRRCPLAQPRDAARGRLWRRRLRKADRRGGQRPLDDESVQCRHPAARRPGHERARAGGRQAAGVRRADGHRRHRHGHRGDEVLAGLARGDRRRDRDQRQWPGDGRRAGGRRAATRTCPAA